MPLRDGPSPGSGDRPLERVGLRFATQRSQEGVPMRTKRLAGFASALGLVALLFSGAAVRASAAAGPHRSTDAAVANYLQSLGKDPSQYVILRGQRTYAGPKCPGGDTVWTTATNVVQVGDRTAPSARAHSHRPGHARSSRIRPPPTIARSAWRTRTRRRPPKSVRSRSSIRG